MKKSNSLALLSGKGGSGKTVLALSISKILSEAGYKVLLIDCDVETHGATYFFESDLDENLLSLICLLDSETHEKKILKTESGFDFIPSTTEPENPIHFENNIQLSALERNIKAYINSGRYNAIIMDCQAGYSALVKQLVKFSDQNLIVLEPDAVSSSALRVLHLQLGTIIGRSNTWQIFNKLTEDERPVYEKVSSGTLFSSLPPVPFDWRVRAAFATCEIPGITAKESAFSLGVLRIMKTLYKPFVQNLKEVEDKAVGDWHHDIQEKLKRLAIEKAKYESKASEFRRKERLNRIRLISGAMASVGVIAFYISFIEKFTRIEIAIETLSMIIGVIIIILSILWYIWNIKDVRSERRREESLEALKEVESEMAKFSTLLATDPWLREYGYSVVRESEQKTMLSYYINQNAQNNGDHEVHKEGCSYMPNPENRIYLGSFSNCHDAVREATKHYLQSNGCYYCTPECYTE